MDLAIRVADRRKRFLNRPQYAKYRKMVLSRLHGVS